MKTLVIYDSQFGNTAKIAHAIGEALRAYGDVAVLRVSEVRPEHWAGAGLVVVGSPTQRFRPLPSITQLLAGIPPRGLAGVKVAAFDTRVPDAAQAPMRVFLQASPQKAADVLGDCSRQQAAIRLPLQDSRQHFRCRVAGKSPSS